METSDETMKKKRRIENRETEIHIHDLPMDVALIIASYLPERDVCALGSCNRYWREVCRSDSIWSSLYLKRWPSLFKALHPSQDWLEQYVKRIRWMERSISFVIQAFAGKHRPSDFWKRYKVAEKQLTSIQFCFADVVWFFNRRMNISIYLLGIMYSVNILGVSRKGAVSALTRRRIHDHRDRGRLVFGQRDGVVDALTRHMNHCHIVCERVADVVKLVFRPPVRVGDALSMYYGWR